MLLRIEDINGNTIEESVLTLNQGDILIAKCTDMNYYTQACRLTEIFDGSNIIIIPEWIELRVLRVNNS
jgi:hypothetical protein